MNIKSEIKSCLSNKLIDKLSSNSLVFLDNLKNQKTINRFNQIVTFNNSFEYESKKLLCDQMTFNMGYEENSEGEHIISKLIGVTEGLIGNNGGMKKYFASRRNSNNVYEPSSCKKLVNDYSSNNSFCDKEIVEYSTALDSSSYLKKQVMINGSGKEQNTPSRDMNLKGENFLVGDPLSRPKRNGTGKENCLQTALAIGDFSEE